MYKVYLFGSRSLAVIPDAIINHIKAIITEANGDVQFIVGDSTGVESGFHKALASLGLTSKTLLYCMDSPRSNTYDLQTKTFKSEYNPETLEVAIVNDGTEYTKVTGIQDLKELYGRRDYFEFKDRQMIKDCDFAICFWDGESKGTMKIIDILKAQNKYVYVYTAQIH